MEDREILALYEQREERAIELTREKYGPLLHSITWGILRNYEDSEECVSDTYHKAWESIPPQKPQSLMAYLGRISRNLALNCRKKALARKRNPGNVLLFSELSECIPAGEDAAEQA